MAITGHCHCGNVSFSIDGTIPPALTRCTCSFCARRGALYAYYEPDQFHPRTGTSDSIYRWNTRWVAHHSCAECGCSTWSDSPAFGKEGSWDGKTRRIGVNARLFDEFDAASAPVIVLDGKNLW